MLPISDAQLLKFTEQWAGNPEFANGNGNNRAIQDLGDRILYYKGAVSLVAAAGASLLMFALAF